MSASSYDDFRQRREESVWHSLNRLMVALIIFAVFILIFCAFIPLLKQQRELGGRADDLRVEARLKTIELARAEREEELLRHDPEYVEMVARGKLDRMKEGETIFHLQPPPIPDPSEFRRKP